MAAKVRYRSGSPPKAGRVGAPSESAAKSAGGGGVTARSEWSHLCDIGVEQLGSGLHQPLKGVWSWLGLAVTERGDVVVADMDGGCVYLL